MNDNNLNDFSISKWYSIFHKKTIKSRIINVDQNFLKYLQSDNFFLPSQPNKIDLHALQNKKLTDPNTNNFDLNETINKINNCITALGGKVVPKFTWSVPQDAKWISPEKSLCCQNAEEVLLLLKSSNYVTRDFDISETIKNQSGSVQNFTHRLALRKFTELLEQYEFRCFVVDNKIRGISQRDIFNFHTDLAEEIPKIKNDILEFYDKEIKNKFTSPTFVVDIYISSFKKVRIMDFGPFSTITDPLLFSWPELESENLPSDNSFEFRIIEDFQSVKGVDPNRWSSMPVDFMHLYNGIDFDKFSDIMNLKDNIKSYDEYSSDDE